MGFLKFCWQVMQPSYGLYVWPSAPVLAQYIWHKRDQIKGRKILEVKRLCFRCRIELGGGGGEIMIWYFFKAPLKYIEALTICSIYWTFSIEEFNIEHYCLAWVRHIITWNPGREMWRQCYAEWQWGPPSLSGKLQKILSGQWTAGYSSDRDHLGQV